MRIYADVPPCRAFLGKRRFSRMYSWHPRLCEFTKLLFPRVDRRICFIISPQTILFLIQSAPSPLRRLSLGVELAGSSPPLSSVSRMHQSTATVYWLPLAARSSCWFSLLLPQHISSGRTKKLAKETWKTHWKIKKGSCILCSLVIFAVLNNPQCKNSRSLVLNILVNAVDKIFLVLKNYGQYYGGIYMWSVLVLCSVFWPHYYYLRST